MEEIFVKLEIFKTMSLPETLVKIYTAHPIDWKARQVINFMKDTTTDYVHVFWREKCIFFTQEILVVFIRKAKKSVLKLLKKFIPADFAFIS